MNITFLGPLWIAMETMHYHIAKTGLIFCIKGVSNEQFGTYERIVLGVGGVHGSIICPPDGVCTVTLFGPQTSVWSRIVFLPGVRVRSSEKEPGRTLVRSSGSEKGSGLCFGRFGVWRKERAEPWFGRLGVGERNGPYPG